MTVSFIQRALNRPRFLILVFLLAGLPGLFSPHANATNFETAAIPHEMDDYSSSLAQWQPLAEQGDVIAQLNLGLMYRDGKGVPQDHVAAAKWFLAAARQGDSMAQYSIGVMHEHGYGIPQDYAEAAKWYRRAAEQGLALAQFTLAPFLWERGRRSARFHRRAYVDQPGGVEWHRAGG